MIGDYDEQLSLYEGSICRLVFIGSVSVGVVCKGVEDWSEVLFVLGEDRIGVKEFTYLCDEEEEMSEWSFAQVVVGVACWYSSATVIEERGKLGLIVDCIEEVGVKSVIMELIFIKYHVSRDINFSLRSYALVSLMNWTIS